uniref:Antifreeze protein n=1 Tax=Saussurea involucrata TaxID=200489 RepID=A0FH78_9ASTR|nr:antifreeze protein [Saussurea involucrata]
MGDGAARAYSAEAFVWLIPQGAATSACYLAMWRYPSTASQKRELWPFRPQTSHETTGLGCPRCSGPHSSLHCCIRRRPPTGPTCPGKPLIFSSGRAIGNPDLVESSARVDYVPALCFYMTPFAEFLVSASHQLALTTSLPFVHTRGRVPGSVITNVISPQSLRPCPSYTPDRIGRIPRYCELLAGTYADNALCTYQRPFA